MNKAIFTGWWAIAIATTRAPARWSLLRAIVSTRRSIEQMRHTTLSVFSTMPPANERRDAVASGLVLSLAEAWRAAIGQSRLVQLSWVPGTSRCWRGSGLIKRICICNAQHCLNRDLSCWRGDSFLCRPVSFCRTPFILAICIDNPPALEEILQSCQCWAMNYWWIIDD